MWNLRSAFAVTCSVVSSVLSWRMRWSAPNRVSRRGASDFDDRSLTKTGPDRRLPTHRRTARALSGSRTIRFDSPRRRTVIVVAGALPETSSMSSASASATLSPSHTSSATSASRRGSSAAATARQLATASSDSRTVGLGSPDTHLRPIDTERGVDRSQVAFDGEVVERRQRRPSPPDSRVAVAGRFACRLEGDERGGVGRERDRALTDAPVPERLEIAAIRGAGVR